MTFALFSPCVNRSAEYDPGVGGSETVLVADDDEQLLRLLVRLLERDGNRVLSAADSVAALETFHANADQIDLVVLDVGLDPDGIEKPLRVMLEAKPDLSVILASGDQPPDGIQQQLEEIGGVFLRKPFPPARTAACSG